MARQPKAKANATPQPNIEVLKDVPAGGPPLEVLDDQAGDDRKPEDLETVDKPEDLELFDPADDIAVFDAISHRLEPTMADHQAELERLQQLDVRHQDFCPVRYWQLHYLANGLPIPNAS